MVWNKRTGRPYYNAIVWQDTRTDRIAAALDRDGRGDVIRDKAGLPPATYFSGGKIQWILENVARRRGPTPSAATPCSAPSTAGCIWNLTGGVDGGVHVTDVTNASRTMLMNLETLDWDDELLGFFDIPRAMLPDDPAVVRPEALRRGPRPGALAGVPLTGDLGDQQAAMFGQVCFAPGEAKNTYGTGNFLLLNTGTELVRSKHGLLTTVCYQFGDAARGLRAGRLDRRHRLGRAVAARPARHHLRRGRDRDARRAGRRQRRRATSSRPSPVCSRRTGEAMPAARSSACRASTPRPIWPGPRWSRSATRPATSSTRWRRTPACTSTCSRSTAG